MKYNFDFDRISYILKQSEMSISRDFGFNISTYFPRFYEENNEIDDETLYLKAYCSEYKVFDLILYKNDSAFVIVDTSYEMEINLHISVNDNDAGKLSQSLFLITSSLSNIQNVEVKFENIEIGSLVATVRLYIKNLMAKEEVKAVLETAKEGVVKSITAGQVSHSETKKKSAETKKTIKESELLDLELKSKPTESESKFLNALNIEKLALENEELRIKNAKAKLEIIEKLSDLAEKGILEADSIQIDINGFTYLLNNDTEQFFLPDNSIDNIT